MSVGAIGGLLFDKDGTLFDFAATWAVVTDMVLAELAPDAPTAAEMGHAVGYDPATRTFAPGSAIVAGTLGDNAALWASFRPDLGAWRIAEIAERITDEAVFGGALVPAHPDLAGFLQALRGQGYRLGVATNDTEAAARLQLGSAGVLDAFDWIAGADSGHGAKPGPGMLLAFARDGGLDPAEVAMIGDSLHDMAMAERAGIRIGVLTGPAVAADLEHAADIVLDSIAALPEFLEGLAGDAVLRKRDMV
jgi:phosphoglycolate phosphatase